MFSAYFFSLSLSLMYKFKEVAGSNPVIQTKKSWKTQYLCGFQDFLRYVKIDTQSAENDLHPSTAKQHDLAKLLYEELKAMGASDVIYDKEHCYVYATVPGNTDSDKVLGFIAHMDTSQAVTDTKIEELTREVRAHNNFAQRMPVVEEQIKMINHRIDDLEEVNKHK